MHPVVKIELSMQQTKRFIVHCLETSIKGSKGILLNIRGGKSLGMMEIQQAADLVYREADPDANIIMGAVIDESLKD